MILPEVLVFSHAALEWAARDGRRRTGLRIRDRRGRMIDIGDWRPEDWDGLLAMYRSFEPAQRVDGLPPLGEERLAVWVDVLWRSGPNIVARAGDQVVGHAALVRDGDGYELMVFVHPDQQGAGIGRAMIDEALAVRARADLRPPLRILPPLRSVVRDGAQPRRRRRMAALVGEVLRPFGRIALRRARASGE